jgi:hypothetical protein
MGRSNGLAYALNILVPGLSRSWRTWHQPQIMILGFKI